MVDSKILDHRLITWKVIFGNTLPNSHPKTSNQTTTKRIPQDYFEDPEVHKQMSHLATQLDEEQSHPTIDGLYTNFCRLIDEQLLHKPLLKPSKMYGKRVKNFHFLLWGNLFLGSRFSFRRGLLPVKLGGIPT